MSRAVMKNGDIVNLESYDWSAYRSPVQLQIVAREIRQKAESCMNDYPGHKIIFCFNSEFGTVPTQVQNDLTALNVEVQIWP